MLIYFKTNIIHNKKIYFNCLFFGFCYSSNISKLLNFVPALALTVKEQIPVVKRSKKTALEREEMNPAVHSICWGHTGQRYVQSRNVIKTGSWPPCGVANNR